MPTRGRSHGHGDAEEGPSRPHLPHGISHVRGGEEAVAEVAARGRSTANGGTGAGVAPPGRSAQPDDVLTQSTGRPGGTPDGHPTAIEGERPDVRRSLERENDGAAILADKGYRVKQNPTKPEVAQARLDSGDTGSVRSKPDYLVEGRVFDCYSPTEGKAVRGIHWEVENKVVTKRQTQRMVVNLMDWGGDMAALRKQFIDWPIPALKELKAITPEGHVVQIPLPPGNQ